MNQLQRVVIETRVRVEANVLAMQDKRYRVLVTLIRSDRPRYWNFRCMNCGSKLAELQNMEVYSIDDFYDPQNVNNSGVGVHCKGKLADRGVCPYSYFFHAR